MTRGDWFIFIFTFIVGMTAGMFLYVTSFKPVYQPEGISQDPSSEELAVIGKSYGGMQPTGYVHPSFRVTNDGAYSYFEGGVDATADDPIEGTLPSSLMSDLRVAIKDADLDELSEQRQKEECRTFSDSIDYIYRITLDGEQYELDTCRSAIGYNHELVRTLESVWMYFEDPTGYQRNVPSGSSGGSDSPRNFLEDFLRSYFVSDEDESVTCTAEAKICPDGTAVGRTGPNCEFAVCPGE